MCEAPCDRPIRVESLELRIAGAGVTPSNAFVVQSSQSQIPLDVAPGRSDLRSLGILGLVIGSPVAVLGGVGIGVGVGTDVKGHETMQTVGIITAIVGGVLTLAALPLLALGSTSVRTAKGETIARALTGRLSF